MPNQTASRTPPSSFRCAEPPPFFFLVNRRGAVDESRVTPGAGSLTPPRLSGFQGMAIARYFISGLL